MVKTEQVSTTSPQILEGWIQEEELARQLGVSVRTCQRYRALRRAPPHVVIGRAVYYRVEGSRDWIARQEVRSRLQRTFERTR